MTLADPAAWGASKKSEQYVISEGPVAPQMEFQKKVNWKARLKNPHETKACHFSLSSTDVGSGISSDHDDNKDGSKGNFEDLAVADTGWVATANLRGPSGLDRLIESSRPSALTTLGGQSGFSGLRGLNSFGGFGVPSNLSGLGRHSGPSSTGGPVGRRSFGGLGGPCSLVARAICDLSRTIIT